LQPGEAEIIGRSAEDVAEWLHANCKVAIEQGIRRGMAKYPLSISTRHPDEIYGIALEELSMKDSVRAVVRRIVIKGDTPDRYVSRVAEMAAWDCCRNRTIESRATRIPDPEHLAECVPALHAPSYGDYAPQDLIEIAEKLAGLPRRLRSIVKMRLTDRKTRSFEGIAKRMMTARWNPTADEIRSLYHEALSRLGRNLEHLRP